MKAGSLRKDCLLAFLERWVERVLGADCDAGGFGFIISSPPGPPPPPPPPPPAAKIGVSEGPPVSAIRRVPNATSPIRRLIILCLLFANASNSAECVTPPLRHYSRGSLP